MYSQCTNIMKRSGQNVAAVTTKAYDIFTIIIAYLSLFKMYFLYPLQTDAIKCNFLKSLFLTYININIVNLSETAIPISDLKTLVQSSPMRFRSIYLREIGPGRKRFPPFFFCLVADISPQEAAVVFSS